MSTPPPIPQPLRDDLVEVVRVGIEAAGDLHAPDLARVARELVPHAALGDAIKGALDKALETLGDTPYARSGRALIGQTPATKGAKLGARREAAAEEVPISPRQFRRPGSYESRVIEVIGNALLELTRSGRLVAPPGGGAALSKLGGQVQIVPATPSDHDFVVELMTAALSPYYGGDHRAHADRIFTTHISGGQDHLGFFSLEQRMFVATLGGDPRSPRLGMVHLVAKRQGTYKISPLIVAPEVRGRLHIGSRLLDFAEKHARSNEARELYCTVAEDNRPALQFFLRNGFVIAGRSDSHYQAGVTEVMLYKLLAPAEADRVFDTPNISVLPMETDHEDQVRTLLLRELPRHFSGIDDSWVDSLFKGYERRAERDVNRKFKLLFVATDRAGEVLGLAAATPKKGEPIKLMPLIATSLPAFTALVTDLPFQMQGYGRKLYAHIAAGPAETVALQARGWRHDASLPAAYHTDHVTQQWSIDIHQEGFMRTMRVKQRYLDFIKAGTKPLEVRVGYDSVKRIRPGERIRFASREDSQVVLVQDVRTYPDFNALAVAENLGHVVPGETPARALAILREIYPPDKERLGVIVLEVAPTQG